MNETDATCHKTAEELQQDLDLLLDHDACWHHLELLGVTDADDIIFCNWMKVGDDVDAMHQRENLSEDIVVRVKGGDYSFGFIPSKPLPKPEGWRSQWMIESSWDPELQVCWKEQTYGSKAKEIECCRALMAVQPL